MHNGRSLQKKSLSEQKTKLSSGYHFDKLVIAGAQNEEIDTACFITENGQVMPLDVNFDDQMSTLNLSRPASQT